MFYRSGWLRCVLVISIGLAFEFIFERCLCFGRCVLVKGLLVIDVRCLILCLCFVLVNDSRF
jgi:hypothetical protein